MAGRAGRDVDSGIDGSEIIAGVEQFVEQNLADHAQ